MNRKLKKRLLPLVLVMAMVFEMVAAGLVTSDPIEAEAATSKKVTNDNIYHLAPEYLNNPA